MREPPWSGASERLLPETPLPSIRATARSVAVGFRPNPPARPIQGIHARKRGTFSHLATWRLTTRERSGHNEQRLCDAALTRGNGFDETRIPIHRKENP